MTATADPIHIALAAVMADVGAVAKNDRNQAQNFNFRGIDAVINAVGPAFRARGVIALPLVEDAHYEQIEVGKNRSLMRQCTLTVRWRFVGPAGDHMDAVVVAEAMDSGDKATSKAHSVAYRTALLQVLCIPTDDPDPDATSYERAPAPEPVQRVSEAEADELRKILNAASPDDRKAFVARFGCKPGDLPALDYPKAKDWLSDLEAVQS